MLDMSELPKRRKVVLSPKNETKKGAENVRKLVRPGIPSGAATPRTLQMPPPGYILPDHLTDSRKQPVSGANASGSIYSVDSSEVDQSADSTHPRMKKTRVRRVITPEEAQTISAMNITEERQALDDAESLWHMLKSPVYGDPVLIEEEFSELAIRFAKRGIRWVKMAQMTNIQAANRRIRSEHRARVGYGRLKPQDRVPAFSSHEEFDLAKQQYVETLNLIIESRQPSGAHPRGTGGNTPP